jgi:anti-sigma B factor antagonist
LREAEVKDKTSDDLLVVELEPVREDVVIVRLVGEIDLSSAHLLSTQLAQLARPSLSAVILDAAKVGFMDSTGLHALVEGKRALHEMGTEIYLVPSRQVGRVLELVFPDKLFAARVASVDEALAAIETAATA